MNATNNIIDHSDLRFSSRGRNSQEEAPLSEKENQLREILSKVDRRTIIGECIATAIHSGKPPFRKLIDELKDQLRDAPDALEGVIGETGAGLLREL